MAEKIIQDRVFEQKDIQDFAWGLGGYELDNCRFLNVKGQNLVLSGIRFMDCHFEDCDLSMAKVEGAVFQNVRFKGCKLMGVLFDSCDPFSLELQFEHCNLDHSSFMGLKIHNAVFKHCSLKGVDFTRAQLKGACFVEADLLDARFDQTFLEKADFTGALHYTIQPSKNKLKSATFSLDGIAGLLTEYGIKIKH